MLALNERPQGPGPSNNNKNLISNSSLIKKKLAPRLARDDAAAKTSEKSKNKPDARPFDRFLPLF
jgi:hypothetical protein